MMYFYNPSQRTMQLFEDFCYQFADENVAETEVLLKLGHW